MKYCDQCGRELNKKAKFCPSCGAPAFKDEKTAGLSVCTNCGEPIVAGSCYCANCGERCSVPRAETYVLPAIPKQKSIPNLKGDEDNHSVAEYLGKVVSLEKSVYIQTQTINELVNRVENLGHPETIQKPNKPAEHVEHYLSGMWEWGFWGGVVLGFIVWVFSRLSFLNSMLLGFFVCGSGVLISHALSSRSAQKEQEERYNNWMADYHAAMERDRRRVEEEQNEKRGLIPIVTAMEQQRDETAAILEKYYSKDIIFPKYRNLVAVCSLNEYFISGRCNSLTGHEGAYNIFENEVRLERVCTTLDEVVERLDEIKMNQYLLYDAIQEGNRITQSLVEESVRQSRLAERTAENTALAAHYAEIAANNAEACAWIGLANYEEIRKGRK